MSFINMNDEFLEMILHSLNNEKQIDFLKISAKHFNNKKNIIFVVNSLNV